MPKKIFIFGCGGHAKVIGDIIDSDGTYVVSGYVNLDRSPLEFNGQPVYEEKEFIEKYSGESVVIAIGENRARKEVFSRLAAHSFSFPNLIHPSAVISKSVEFSCGTVVMPNVVINSSSKIGKGCVLNTASVLEHDCILEDYVSLAPKSVICGGCRIKEGAYIGANASVIPSKIVGQWSIVAAQAAVISDVSPNVIAVGVPAKIKKKYSDSYS